MNDEQTLKTCDIFIMVFNFPDLSFDTFDKIMYKITPFGRLYIVKDAYGTSNQTADLIFVHTKKTPLACSINATGGYIDFKSNSQIIEMP